MSTDGSSERLRPLSPMEVVRLRLRDGLPWPVKNLENPKQPIVEFKSGQPLLEKPTFSILDVAMVGQALRVTVAELRAGLEGHADRALSDEQLLSKYAQRQKSSPTANAQVHNSKSFKAGLVNRVSWKVIQGMDFTAETAAYFQAIGGGVSVEAQRAEAAQVAERRTAEFIATLGAMRESRKPAGTEGLVAELVAAENVRLSRQKGFHAPHLATVACLAALLGGVALAKGQYERQFSTRSAIASTPIATDNETAMDPNTPTGERSVMSTPLSVTSMKFAEIPSYEPVGEFTLGVPAEQEATFHLDSLPASENTDSIRVPIPRVRPMRVTTEAASASFVEPVGASARLSPEAYENAVTRALQEEQLNRIIEGGLVPTEAPRRFMVKGAEFEQMPDGTWRSLDSQAGFGLE